MDISIYYQEFRDAYIIATIAVLLTLAAVLFIGIRSILDKKETVLKKTVNCILLLSILSFVVSSYFSGPYLGKKDFSQKTIHSYKGDFEIVETSKGIINKAIFLIDNKEISLRYFKEDDYDFEIIKPGKYNGTLVYAQNSAQVLYIELD